MDIKPQQLTQALTMRRTVLKHDVVVTRHHIAEAVNTRDAMAKCLYHSLFHWIVLRINQALLRKESIRKSYIGILDIFGFEDVGGSVNSFEQVADSHLCFWRREIEIFTNWKWNYWNPLKKTY